MRGEWVDVDVVFQTDCRLHVERGDKELTICIPVWTRGARSEWETVETATVQETGETVDIGPLLADGWSDDINDQFLDAWLRWTGDLVD